MHDLRVLAWKQTIMESFIKICDYAWTTRFDGYRELVLKRQSQQKSSVFVVC